MLSCQFPTVIFLGPKQAPVLQRRLSPPPHGREASPGPRPVSTRLLEGGLAPHRPPVTPSLATGETVYMKDFALVPVIRNGRLQDIYWTYSYSPIYGSEGTIDGILIVCHDVTDEVALANRRLRESEARAAASEERFRLALDAANGIGTWDWDVNKDLVYADEGFARLYGVAPEKAATGVTIGEFMRNMHPDDRGRVERAIERALRTGEEFNSEYRLNQSDGSVRWVSAVGRCSYRTPMARPHASRASPST